MTACSLEFEFIVIYVTVGEIILQILRINVFTKIGSQSTDHKSLYSHFFLSFWTNHFTNE